MVVGSVDRVQRRAVDGGADELLELEVGGAEDGGVDSLRGGAGGDRIGEVARRRARERGQARLCAFAAATATTRSLNECVGFAVSSFSQSSPTPTVSASRGAPGPGA